MLYLSAATLGLVTPVAASAATVSERSFPRPLDTYSLPAGQSLIDVWSSRVEAEPFNLIATIIFLLAILHTFFAPKFRHWAHEVEEAHAARIKERNDSVDTEDGLPQEVSFKGQILHFFGEVEAVFGIWAVVLMGALAWTKGSKVAIDYVGQTVNFTEATFVVVIMALASTRPILRFAESGLRSLAAIGRGSVAAWWLVLLIVAPVLGSLITEPAAMTIGALLLARRFYTLNPSPRFGYATLGLLFVNISIGGTLTHFAAPPVLMVAGPWKWDLVYMLTHFGWKALLAIVASTAFYALIFRKDLVALETARRAAAAVSTTGVAPGNNRPVPIWITLVQLAFIVWTVAMAHYPPLFVGGFFFFLVFSRATAHHQSRLELRSPLLVGFFLAGLVVHGGLQGWWIDPLLRRLSEWPLFFGATVLTAFNDNAAVTYLATLVPNFTDALKYAVVAGAVTGGGLTVIANAPNPAGQAILQRFFPSGVSPLRLFLGALPPTILTALCYMVL